MHTIYGALAPLRRLEEIVSWKKREKELAGFIRAASPGLEPQFAQWLADWEQALEAAQRQATEWLERAIGARAGASPPETDPEAAAHALWERALRQSREFTRQLGLLPQMSAAARDAAAFPALLEAARRNLAELEEEERQDDGRTMLPEGAWTDPLAGGLPYLNQANPAEQSAVPIGGHRLPPLPYPYDALEPWIDETTMRIHHDKHHQSYVDGLNNAEKKLAEARMSGDFSLVKHWERELAFHGAGHYLHTIFWQVMKPGGGGRPDGTLAAEINRSFGGFEAFQRQFSEAAKNVEGGGWAILVWSPRSRRLEILTAEKHQNLSQWDVIPLLPLDVWEHAYYLKHQNDRAAYIRDWWNVVNWAHVAERFERARKVQWTPF